MKTPHYIIDRQQLDDSYEMLVNALERNWKNYVVGYSYKTNALPWVINHFNRLGCYAEVVSEDEYNLAKKIGVPLNRIIYNGPIKTKETFLEALKNGCIVNIDSQREIEWLTSANYKDVSVGLRVNFDIEKMCPGQSQCGAEGGRFGFCYENGEFARALLGIQNTGTKVAGLHLHTSSKTRSVDIYKAIARVACDLVQRYDLSLKYIDVGGGFFGGLPDKPRFEEYISDMAEILKTQFDVETTALVVEPGMALIGAPVSYVTTVIDVKDTSYNRFVVTDGTRTSIDPLMTKSRYFHRFERLNDTGVIKRQVICGYTCMEHDRLFECENEPELNVGDRIIYEKVGAYTMCLTPLFIKYFPDVYVRDGDRLSLVREAWSPEEYIQKSVVDVE